MLMCAALIASMSSPVVVAQSQQSPTQPSQQQPAQQQPVQQPPTQPAPSPTQPARQQPIQPTPQPSQPVQPTPQQPTPAQTSPQQPTQATPGGLQNVPATPGQNVGSSGVIIPPQLPAEPPPVAPNYSAPIRPLPSAERVGVDVNDQAPLALNEAIALALANNKEINIARIDVEMAGFVVQAARGVYDPRLQTEVDYERSTTPTASLIGGANGTTTTSGLTGDARVTGNSPLLGGNYSLDFNAARSTTNNQFVSLNPQYPTSLTATYTQPLLRGLRIDEPRRQIEIARRNVTLSDSQFRQHVIDIITRVQQSYWDLVFALRNLQVQIDAVKQARLQLESNRRQVEQGTLAPIDVVAAQTQVATFEQNVYSAQEAVTRAENALKTLMLPDRTAPLWSRAILPTSPVSLDPPRVPLDQAVTTALASRPEVEQVATNAEINRINTRFFRDQTRPQVDLVASYSAAGLAGTQITGGFNPFTASNTAIIQRLNQLSATAGLPPLDLPTTSSNSLPGFLIGGAGQSFANLFGFNFPTTRVGIVFSFPVGNRTAEANLGRSLAEGRRITNQRQQVEQTIEQDVRNTMQAIRSAEARLAAAASARDSAEQTFASEQRRFNAGLSTVFLVLQRQTEMIAARGRELQAQTDLNKAIADFQRATGSTLAVNNITVLKDTNTPQLQQSATAASAAQR
jgi:outer membrane protein TolC